MRKERRKMARTERVASVQVALGGGRKGQVAIPVGLHERMAQRADVEGRSVAGMVRWACVRYLEAPDVAGQPAGVGPAPGGPGEWPGAPVYDPEGGGWRWPEAAPDDSPRDHLAGGWH